jgi:Cft2 family RNA processing exonuclease
MGFLVKGKKVKVEAFNCGNTIGAALWKIVIDRMVFGYLAEYNHQTEL